MASHLSFITKPRLSALLVEARRITIVRAYQIFLARRSLLTTSYQIFLPSRTGLTVKLCVRSLFYFVLNAYKFSFVFKLENLFMFYFIYEVSRPVFTHVLLFNLKFGCPPKYIV